MWFINLKTSVNPLGGKTYVCRVTAIFSANKPQIPVHQPKHDRR